MRVMIIEDEALVAMSMALILEEAGYEIAGIAGDSAKALALAAEKRPDAATVDMNLKDGCVGGALALTLRRDFGVRPVFITANPCMVPPEAQAIAAAILEKPVSGPGIVAAMKTLGGKAMPAGDRGSSRSLLPLLHMCG